MSLQNLFVQDSGKSFQDIYCDKLVANDVELGAGRQSFLGTATGIWAGSQVAAITYEVIADQVTLYLTGISATANAASFITIAGIPAEITPSTAQSVCLPVLDNGTGNVGTATITTGGSILIYNGGVGAVYTGAGNSGYDTVAASYLL